MIISFLQALLWSNEPTYRYFFAISLHLFSLGWLYFALFQLFSSLLARWDSSYKQKAARIFIGTIFSVANVIPTALELHILVRKHFKLKLDRASCSLRGGIPRLSTATTTTTTTTTVKTAEMDGWLAMVFELLAFSSPFSWLFPGP